MQEGVRYFRSQVFAEDEEMTEAEALGAGSYVAAHYLGSSPDYAEVHAGGRIEVVYYERPLPHESLVEAHRAKYGNVPFKILTPMSAQGGRRGREVYHYGGDGVLWGVDEEQYDERGEMVLERHMDEERRLVGTVEYEYDEDGRLCRARELNPDGTVVYEYEPDK